MYIYAISRFVLTLGHIGMTLDDLCGLYPPLASEAKLKCTCLFSCLSCSYCINVRQVLWVFANFNKTWPL